MLSLFPIIPLHLNKFNVGSIADVVGEKEDISAAKVWINILFKLSCVKPSTVPEICLSIGPFIKCMSSEKLELFGSNIYWYTCLPAFLELIESLAGNREATSILIAYEGFI